MNGPPVILIKYTSVLPNARLCSHCLDSIFDAPLSGILSVEYGAGTRKWDAERSEDTFHNRNQVPWLHNDTIQLLGGGAAGCRGAAGCNSSYYYSTNTPQSALDTASQLHWTPFDVFQICLNMVNVVMLNDWVSSDRVPFFVSNGSP